MSSDSEKGLIGRTIADSKYKLTKFIAAGAFGLLFTAEETKTSNEFAVKLELKDAKDPQLKHEYDFYKLLGIHSGIPKVTFFGECERYHCLVLQLLGPSLETVFDECDRKFSVKTVTLLAIQLMDMFEYIHSRRIIFRDVKPENFLLGLPKTLEAHKLHIIDFGLAKVYKGESGQHIPYREDKGLTGTVRYMSVNTHLHKEQSRRDDMEAIGHVLIYLLKGQLPWQGLKIQNEKEWRVKVGEIKQQTTLEVLCEHLPEEYYKYMTSVRSLDFTQDPDYKSFQDMFQQLLKNRGESDDNIYDWDEKHCRKHKKSTKLSGPSKMRLKGSKLSP